MSTATGCVDQKRDATRVMFVVGSVEAGRITVVGRESQEWHAAGLHSSSGAAFGGAVGTSTGDVREGRDDVGPWSCQCMRQDRRLEAPSRDLVVTGPIPADEHGDQRLLFPGLRIHSLDAHALLHTFRRRNP